MAVVITNDDGIDAPGIRALWDAVGAEGVIVAPADHQSGCGHQVTTHRPLSVEQRSPTEFAVGGTPADCTRLALSHLVPTAEVVLSGINAGGNMGSDIYISGTVAAVREAAMHRIPAIAISQFISRPRPIDWAMATRLTARVLDKLLNLPPEPGTFWNVNLPSLEADAPEPDIVFCALCTQPLPIDFERKGDQFFYVGEYGKRSRDPGADVDVCFSGQISVTQVKL